ncbi:MAG: acyl-CoA mutase large subunit family protein [Bacteroidales bacterium]|nr:acyl-CoA mutase large subunit family protein [Bacteroidales bacterium]
MSNKETNPKLFEDFPPTSTEQWEEKINKDLKGADYEKKLYWKTLEGFDVKPYYRKEDLEEIQHLDTFPGDFPYTRGNSTSKNNWLVRQNIKVNNIEENNKKALDILMKGVDSLGLEFDEDYTPDFKDIERLLQNIFADMVEINYMCGNTSQNMLEIIVELVKKYNRPLDKIHGSVDYDPLGYMTLKGNFKDPEGDPFHKAKKLINLADHLPNFRLLSVNGKMFRNSGSSIVKELGFSLAVGNEYLSKINELNMPVNKITPRIKFTFAVGSNYFMEIAKIRAARLLWSRIVSAYEDSSEQDAQMNIHCVTSSWNMSLYDPNVNMLRTTTEAMSSIIAGTDSLTVLPYDAALGVSTDTSERIARNQQLLLKEESHFDKVKDPAAGSYYIENLTNSIASEAWKLFLEVEENGGYLESLKQGFVQDKIMATAQKRDLAVAKRKENLLGTNQYPDFNEWIDKEIDESILFPEDKTLDNAIVKTLKPYRGAQAFEIVRIKTDRYAKHNGKRPQAFMFTYGNLGMRKARAQFSCNFFACGGFELVDNPGFKSIKDGVKVCLEEKPDIVVICSSDEEYGEIAPAIYEQLKDQSLIVIAGYPKELINELKSKGIEHFIHVKSNVLESLREFQNILGI